MKKIIYGIAMLLLMLPVVSCNDAKGEPENDDIENNEPGNDDPIDGMWEAMEWKVLHSEGNIEFKIISEGLTDVFVYNVGTLDIECTNYKGFWFDYGNYYPEKTETIYQIKKQWCDLKIENNVLHCDFLEMQPNYDNEIDITITAGDIFNTFRFIRK